MSAFERTHLVFDTDAEFERFVEFERERRKRSSDRPMGGRLSTLCPVRICQGVYDDSALSPIDPGDAERGHEIESRVRATLLYSVEHRHQPRVDWSNGITAFDMQTLDALPGVLDQFDLIEVKSTTGSMSIHPDYRSTTQRRMVAAELPIGSVVKLIVVHPGNYRWAGPFDITLDQDTHDKYRVQLGKIERVLGELEQIEAPERESWWRQRSWWGERGLVCECGGCTQHVEIEPNEELERLAFRYTLELDSVDSACQSLGGKASVKWSDAEDSVRTKLLDALNRQGASAIAAGDTARIETTTLKASWSPKMARWTLSRKTVKQIATAA